MIEHPPPPPVSFVEFHQVRQCHLPGVGSSKLPSQSVLPGPPQRQQLVSACEGRRVSAFTPPNFKQGLLSNVLALLLLRVGRGDANDSYGHVKHTGFRGFGPAIPDKLQQLCPVPCLHDTAHNQARQSRVTSRICPLCDSQDRQFEDGIQSRRKLKRTCNKKGPFPSAPGPCLGSVYPSQGC